MVGIGFFFQIFLSCAYMQKKQNRLFSKNCKSLTKKGEKTKRVLHQSCMNNVYNGFLTSRNRGETKIEEDFKAFDSNKRLANSSRIRGLQSSVCGYRSADNEKPKTPERLATFP